jgi:potassium efflux system protein
LGTNAKGWGDIRAVMKVLVPLSIIVVAGLIVASAAGYHYTAIQLTRRVFFSCVFVFACLALRSLLIRWLLVAYRRVVMQQSREKRQALLEAQGQSTTETPAVEKQPQVNLSNVNQQARKLVAVGAVSAFVVSTWFIWGDILPALGIFDRVQLWQSGLMSADPDVDVVYVTLAGLLFSVALFALTWFAGCNLPGLLEIAVLRKLPLDAGARYAANSMARYTIFVVGIALSMRQLGIGWHSVQWLVAAMTVGLGFGLQEIFANFVSGIILLFERPARVGDTVTIGEITGTVTKIRIRATTILDWDSKELIVPNKEFVTGNLVNWTLSTPNLRLIVKVGVAYGSDTRLATQLLYQVAEENPNVLDTPSPSVVFNEFGDSSLNFELRLFVSDLALYRSLRHELHLAIDDLFRQHQISIAFPQCDLHIKSLPAVAQVALSASSEEESDDLPLADDLAA